jgi:hypothetical protein
MRGALCQGTPGILEESACAIRPMRPICPIRPFRVPWKRRPAMPGANGMPIWRRIAIRRYDTVAFVPHADYLIIDSNFCQAPVANQPG